jgi:hypothetical protein
MVRRLRSVLCASVLSSALFGINAGPVNSAEASGVTGASPANLSQVYRQFHDHVLEISKLRLDQAQNVQQAQALLVAPNEVQLSRGWVAAFAEIASQSTRFSEGLEKAAAKRGTTSLIAELKSNPNAVFSIGGVEAAQKDVMAAIAEDSAIYDALTYRLNEIAHGRTGKEADLAQQAQMEPYSAGVTGATHPLAPLSPRAAPLMSQVLALGAIISLSNPSSEKDTKLASLTANAENDQCLRWARLNLNQCLAAAHDGQERSYCLAQHGLDERAKCWSWVAQPKS